jgi:hypothetical protein
VTALRWLGVACAVVAVGVALALPSPSAQVPPPGPVRLTDAWPSAKVSVLPADIGGLRFQPLELLDGGRMLGQTSSADLLTAQLVLRAPDGTLRVLRRVTGTDPPTIAATVVDGERLYWVELGNGADGNRETTVWSVPLTGEAAPVLLARDSGDILFYGSQYDLEVAQGRLWWAASVRAEVSEIRSVPLGGGAETVRQMDRVFALTAWPWVTSSGASVPGDVELLNVTTGEIRRVPGASNEILACNPIWCRITTLVNKGESLRYEVEHPDGTARRLIGDTGLTPLNSDVGIRDRYEVLTSSSTGTAQRLWLHDLSDDRVVLLDDLATANMGARGDYLWWSTGDNETLSWHILDLRTIS